MGAAYVFVRSGTTWSQQAFIKASNTGFNDWFGSKIALSGDGNIAVIGASLEDSGAKGINGKQKDESATEAGAAYLFVRTGTTWTQEAYIKGSNTEAYDEFGSSLALDRSGRTLVVSARGEDGGGRGEGGKQTDNSVEEAGAAYVFRISRRSERDRSGGVVGDDGHFARWAEGHADEPAACDEKFRLGVKILQSIESAATGKRVDDMKTAVDG